MVSCTPNGEKFGTMLIHSWRSDNGYMNGWWSHCKDSEKVEHMPILRSRAYSFRWCAWVGWTSNSGFIPDSVTVGLGKK